MLTGYKATYAELAGIHGQLECHVQQNLYEFAVWVNCLREINARVGLEIGAHMLGSAELTVSAVPSIKRMATIDIQKYRGQDELNRRLERLGSRLAFVQGDSIAPQTVAAVRDVVGESLDFLFIDADHSYVRVSDEFYLYGPLVRSGGLIGFHDIRHEKCWNDDHSESLGPCLGVWQFWRELTLMEPGQCRVANAPAGPWGNFGIGIYEKR